MLCLKLLDPLAVCFFIHTCRKIPTDVCTRRFISCNCKCVRNDCPYCKDVSSAVDIAVASDQQMCTDTCLQREYSQTQIYAFKEGNPNDQFSPTPLLHIVNHSTTPPNAIASILLCLGDGSPGYPLGKLLVLCQIDVPGKPHVIADHFLTDEFELQKPLWYQEVDEHAMQLIRNFNLKGMIQSRTLLQKAGVTDLNHLIQSAIGIDGHINLLPDTFQVSKRPKKTTCDFIKFPRDHMSLLHYTEKSYDGCIETTYFLCLDPRDHCYLIVIEYSIKYQLQLSDGVFFHSYNHTVLSFVSKDSRQHKWSDEYASKAVSNVIPKLLRNKGYRDVQQLTKFGKSQRY